MKKHIIFNTFFIVVVLFYAMTSTCLAATYYISTNGSDSKNGLSKENAWATFSYAFQKLAPGDTLMIGDGSYGEKIYPTVSGSPGLPITLKAENRGKAIIAPVNNAAAIEIYSTTSKTISYITIDGLIARSRGEYAAIRLASSDNASEAQMTNNITIKNLGAFGSANLTNTVVIDLGNNLRDSLLEDVWAYGFGRKAMQAFGCMRLTVRRAVLRYDYWDGSGYKPNDPRITFSGYNTQDSIFENIVAIDSAPTPPSRSADRAAFVASGNQTPAIISGSKRNKYLGMLSLNNYGNGLEVNGGSGGPNEDLIFKDIIIWDSQYYGINIQGNDVGSIFSNITAGFNGLTGFRVNPNPSYPISNEELNKSFFINNGAYGYYVGSTSQATVLNTVAKDNISQSNVEASYAPTMNYVVKPDMVTGHERGANIVKRYVDGVLTNDDLWPWPNEELIKEHMCNPTDLAATYRVASNGDGWEPSWCATDKTLTEYVWGYLGNTLPPFNVKAEPGNAKAFISWNANMYDAGVTGYKIYKGDNSGHYTLYATVEGNTPNAIVTGLTNNEEHKFVVRTVAAGGESGDSYEVKVTPIPIPPKAPVGVGITAPH